MAEHKELSAGANMAWSAFGSMVDLACQWLISIVIVRVTASFTDAGVYALASSVYGVVHPIAQYKMYTFHLSDVSFEYSFKEYLAFNYITCILAFSACVIYSLITVAFSSLGAVVLYTLYRLVKVTIDVFHAEDQRNGRMDFIGISLALQGVFSLAIFSCSYFLFHSLCLSLASMVFAVVLICVAYDFGRTSMFVDIEVGISFSKAKGLLLKCAPVVLGGVACSLAPAVPKQVLQALSGDAELGIYASVAAPVAIIQMGANYIYYPLLGYFAKYYRDCNRVAFRRLLLLVTFVISLIGLACILLIKLVGVQVLVAIFGENIRAYAYLLTPIIVASLITAYMWFLTDLLVSVRGLKSTLVGNVLSLFVAVTASGPMIGRYSMNGVSYVLIAAYLISTLFMVIQLFRKLSTCVINSLDGDLHG